MGAGLLCCRNRNGYQEHFWGRHEVGKSLKDLEGNPPLFIEASTVSRSLGKINAGGPKDHALVESID